MICLIDVMSTLDNKADPIGHGLKILRDLPKYFEEDVKILAGKEYIRKLKGQREVLPCCLYSGIHKNTALKVLYNYFISLIKAKSDILIYTIVSEPLLWGIAFFKGKQKIVIVTYEHWDRYIQKNLANSPIRRFLLKKGLANVDGCIVTNLLYTPNRPYIRIPDYCITDGIRKYKKNEKKDGCICLGEIRYGKDIEGLIRVMKRTDIFLLIAGSFQNKELYQKIRGKKIENIKIENRNLPYKTYIEYLSAYKYVVLPYDVEYYDGRTSGVLLEGIFLGAIPIAPKNLLKQNRINGLGYNNISEIPELICLYEEGKIVVENDLQKYQPEQYKRKISKFLNKLRFI